MGQVVRVEREEMMFRAWNIHVCMITIQGVMHCGRFRGAERRADVLPKATTSFLEHYVRL